MRLAILEEAVRNTTTDKEIEEIEHDLIKLESYEFPLENNATNLRAILFGDILRSAKHFADKYPYDPDVQRILELLGQSGK